MLAFYPSGKAMDQRGRVWVAVPSVVIMGASLVLIPLTGGLISFLLVSMMMGLGNGVGSGLVMTLAPTPRRARDGRRFWGFWGLFWTIGAVARRLCPAASPAADRR